MGCDDAYRSESDASSADSALLSEDAVVGFRRAARSPPRGFADASIARVDGCRAVVSMLGNVFFISASLKRRSVVVCSMTASPMRYLGCNTRSRAGIVVAG